ncbi:unnamed protein product, partial [Discosporangium mesarthrocarpum]
MLPRASHLRQGWSTVNRRWVWWALAAPWLLTGVGMTRTVGGYLIPLAKVAQLRDARCTSFASPISRQWVDSPAWATKHEHCARKSR